LDKFLNCAIRQISEWSTVRRHSGHVHFAILTTVELRYPDIEIRFTDPEFYLDRVRPKQLFYRSFFASCSSEVMSMRLTVNQIESFILYKYCTTSPTSTGSHHHNTTTLSMMMTSTRVLLTFLTTATGSFCYAWIPRAQRPAPSTSLNAAVGIFFGTSVRIQEVGWLLSRSSLSHAILDFSRYILISAVLTDWKHAGLC